MHLMIHLDVNELPTTIDGFVYLPGSINLRPFKGLSLESFQEDLDINVLSLIKVLKTYFTEFVYFDQC